MKIISKYKDYYDYYQGIFGIDNKLVFDRRSDNNFIISPSIISDDTYHYYRFAICNKIYSIFLYKNNFYSSLEELNILSKKLWKDTGSGLDNELSNIWRHHSSEAFKIRKEDWKELNYELKLTEHKINSKYREPILIYHNKEWYKNVILKEYSFHKVMNAKDLFIEISSFLGWLVDNPPIENTQTNKDKLLSHGFDIKKSFRHRK